jgi:hypothetical protein
LYPLDTFVLPLYPVSHWLNQATLPTVGVVPETDLSMTDVVPAAGLALTVPPPLPPAWPNCSVAERVRVVFMAPEPRRVT